MSAFDQYEIIDDAFRSLVLANVKLRKISSDHLWTEGPVWFPAHNALLFSDIPNEKIYRYIWNGSVSVFRDRSNFANGNVRDLDGRLVSCQHGDRSVSRTEHDGSIIKLASSFEGKQLNSPNDVVVKSDGTIWFTDPTYGIMTDYEGYKAEPEQDKNRVYCIDAKDGALVAVCSDCVQPNGLAFSPDESVLYVADSGKSHNPDLRAVVRAYDVSSPGSLKNGRDFVEINPGIPDGLRVDTDGNLWVSAADGVHCISAGGKLLGKILVPETVSNLTFGGPRGNVLFITATSGVYSIYVNASSASRR